MWNCLSSFPLKDEIWWPPCTPWWRLLTPQYLFIFSILPRLALESLTPIPFPFVIYKTVRPATSYVRKWVNVACFTLNLAWMLKRQENYLVIRSTIKIGNVPFWLCFAHQDDTNSYLHVRNLPTLSSNHYFCFSVEKETCIRKARQSIWLSFGVNTTCCSCVR